MDRNKRTDLDAHVFTDADRNIHQHTNVDANQYVDANSHADADTDAWTRTSTATPRNTATPTFTNTATPAPTNTANLGLTGQIYYYGSNQPVSAATVQLAVASTSSQTQETLTDNIGQFGFTGISVGDWLIQPQKLGDKGAALSALDAVYILQASLGLRSLTGEQHVACDVSGNGSVTAVDAVLILQYKVGLISSFPVAQACGSDWGFVPKPATAANQDVIDPVLAQGTCESGAIAFHPLAGQVDNQDFAALVFGDCTGNWQPGVSGASASRSATGRRPVRTRLGRPRRSGFQVRIPLAVYSAATFESADMRIDYDPTELTAPAVQPVRAARDALVVVNDRQPGKLILSLASSQPLESGAILMLQFDALSGEPRPDAIRVVSVAIDE